MILNLSALRARVIFIRVLPTLIIGVGKKIPVMEKDWIFCIFPRILTLPNIITLIIFMIKSRRLRWAGHVAKMGGKRGVLSKF